MIEAGDNTGEVGIWPGWDVDWVLNAFGDAGPRRVTETIAKIESEHTYSEGKHLRAGSPLAVRGDTTAMLTSLCGAYHRCISSFVDIAAREREIMRWLNTPRVFRDSLERTPEESSRLDIMRLDTMLQPDGSVRVLETNANCPGGTLFVGDMLREWAVVASERAASAFTAEFLARPGWFGRWLADVIGVGRHVKETIALVCRRGSNRLEFPEMLEDITASGMHGAEWGLEEVGFEVDARRSEGPLVAYLKLGLQDAISVGDDLTPLLRCLESGALRVQNGRAGRWIGDSKLCLAAMSGTEFEGIFDSQDIAIVRKALPWSRGMHSVSKTAIREIKKNPAGYVLKAPLDTRGKGVFVGLDYLENLDDWATICEVAATSHWLVQEHVTTTCVPEGTRCSNASGEAAGRQRHDLDLVVLGGGLVGAMSRSSVEQRLNVARTGALHSVVMLGGGS